jgi:hypothetical protein
MEREDENSGIFCYIEKYKEEVLLSGMTSYLMPATREKEWEERNRKSKR